ncbi:MAG: sigma-70 family RNA polymerase sigma factor [Anaerolineae bacterium]
MNLSTVDQQHFGQLTEPHRRELKLHCYRMMGSLQEAEDMVQETFLRAWRRRETYEGRASLRAWLYRIATNVCLDMLDKRPQRAVPITYQEVSTLDEPIPPSVMEPIWLEPYPDEWLISDEESPERFLSIRENISIAFVAALHLLPPRQRAILILRDVLELSANEVADLLEITVSAVKSALHRARTTLATAGPALKYGERDGNVVNKVDQDLLDQYVHAWETADVDGLVRMLKEDATFSMPPIPAWYQGHDNIRGLVSKTVFAGPAHGRWRLVPTYANGQQAFGLYRVGDVPGVHSAYGIQVLQVEDGKIVDIITFRSPALVAQFGLPESLHLVAH